MKKYIVSVTKAELLRKKEEWRRAYDARMTLYNGQLERFNAAADIWEGKVKSKVTNQFSEYFNRLSGLEVWFDAPYDSDRGRLRILFSCAGPMNWEYTIEIPDTKQSNISNNSVLTRCYWKGGNVESRYDDVARDIDDLSNSIQCITAITNLDWLAFLNDEIAEMPKYKQYISIKYPGNDPDFIYPDFESQIIQLDIDRLVGKDYWIKCDDESIIGNTIIDYAWVKLVSETDNSYNLYFIPDILEQQPTATAYEILDGTRNTITVSKPLRFMQPLDVLSGEELKELLDTHKDAAE